MSDPFKYTTYKNNYDFLQLMCQRGLARRGFDNNPEYQERLDKELNVVHSGNLEDFFLNTSYMCMKAKSNDILVGMGRGSAAGSLICYCLKITEIDPIKYNLSFERFLNETRINDISSADIDSDIPRDKRQSLLAIVKEDFGKDKTYQIINKLKWTEKTAIKDLGRVIGIPFSVTNRITQLIPDDSHATDIPEVQKFLDNYPFVRDNYLRLVGMIKSYGVHAGGVITLDKPVEYYDSIVKVNGVECLDNDGKTCDKMGFLKNDLLGLNTLTIISDCLELLPGVKLPVEFNDSAVFDTINKSTLGIFQIEAAGASEVCYKLQPQNFDELCAVVALCRPGAMDSGDTEHYIARKHGEEPVIYDHPKLEPILKDNYGAIIYQEDVMHIVTDFAGLTPVDADNVRRGIGKKIQEVFDEYYPKFLNSCIANGIDEDVAIRIWEKIEKSGSYSFNKSHCVSYTALSYICGWLKTYYPIEFYLAILNNTKSEDKKIAVYNECKAIDSEIMNPDINLSKERTIAGFDNKIYLSFNLVKEVGPKAIEKIIENQPYSSYNDFKDRCDVNSKVTKALIEAGAFDRFGYRRDELYSLNLDEDDEEKGAVWSDKEMLFREFQRIKINPNGNVLDLYNLKDLSIEKEISSIGELKENIDEYQDFYIKVLVSDFSQKEDYAFVGVTDKYDTLSLFLSKEFISRYLDDVKEVGTPLLCHVHGKSGKYNVLSLINLQDPYKHEREWWFYTHKNIKTLKELQETNTDINVGIVSGVNYFVSKNGNNCVRYNVFVDDNIFLEGRIACGNPPLMVEGSFIFFYVDDNPVFLQIMQVV